MIETNGVLKDYMEYIRGIYILGSNLVNGKPYWIKEDESIALWYNIYDGNGNWSIGNPKDLGSSTSYYLYSSIDESDVPINIISWFYIDGDELIETNDVSILVAKGIY